MIKSYHYDSFACGSLSESRRKVFCIMAKKTWADIIKQIDTKTQVLALICLVAEALFAASLATLPKEQTIYALIVCAAILMLMIGGIVAIELFGSRKPDSKPTEVIPSPLTPSTDLLDKLVNGALQTVCRAVSIPETPETAKLRVFIFRRRGNQLICTHYWAANPVKELVGNLRFDINSEVAKCVAVVRAFIDNKITRTDVKPLPPDMPGKTGLVSEELTFVLATPIHGDDGDVWGTVDFDAANEIGRQILSNEKSDAAMFQLAQHLEVIFSIQKGVKNG